MRKKALIYCSVSSKDMGELLVFQEGILSVITTDLGYEIFAVCRDYLNSEHLDSYVMQKVLMYVRRKSIDAIILWDSTRISSNNRVFEDFKMYSMKYDVEIIQIHEIHKEISLIY